MYFNVRNILPKSGTFPPGHPVYIIPETSLSLLDAVYLLTNTVRDIQVFLFNKSGVKPIDCSNHTEHCITSHAQNATAV